ncbi:MAG: nucleotidyl transferase AbiEii/AbiGii toxin family protein [Cyanobacteria bacterium J06560_2]
MPLGMPTLDQLPFLRSVCWQGEVASITQLTEGEILQLYERNWQYRGVTADLSKTETRLLQQLATKYRSWVVNELAPMQFRYPTHNQILRVLQTLNYEFLESCQAYFGGGTMLALAYGEYRLSRDIDFLCPYGKSFSYLRREIHSHGYDALFNKKEREHIQLLRDIRTSRDGIRFTVQLEESVFKVEIVAEGRIALDQPIFPDWSPVNCLSLVDQIAEKLLANGDRWPDTSVDSRDLIDLAVLRLKTPFPERALEKAEAAYPTIEPLKRSIQNFQAKSEYRLRCYERLQVRSPTEIISGLDLLAQQLNLPLFNRQSIERE